MTQNFIKFTFLLLVAMLGFRCTPPVDGLNLPPEPTFTYTYHTNIEPVTGHVLGYYLELENTTQDTVDVGFSWQLSGVTTRPTSNLFYVPSSQDTVYQVVRLIASRDGESLFSEQTILLTYLHITRFEITKGILYSIPATRPDGSPWESISSQPDSLVITSSYYFSSFFDGNALPDTAYFTGYRYTGGIGNVTTLKDPEPNINHRIVISYYTQPSTNLNTRIDSLMFIPNDFRIPGTDSGHVVLQNPNTHLELDLKFYD